MKLIILAALLACTQAEITLKAVVVIDNADIKGNVVFTQTDSGVKVEGTINGLPEGKHGFHIHALGDLRKGCDSALGHYNPFNKNHGAPEDAIRHVGDLGNIESSKDKVAVVNIVDSVISLKGEHNIVGRALVIHSGVDDLGKGKNETSLTTGNAGARVACGIVGIL